MYKSLLAIIVGLIITVGKVYGEDKAVDMTGIWTIGYNAMDVADIDNDGVLDVVAGISGIRTAELYIRDVVNGSKYWGTLSDTMFISAVKVGDVDNNGDNEIVVYLTKGHDYTGELRVYKYTSGSLTLLGSMSIGNYVMNQALQIGDFDNDGENEIVVGCDFYERAIYAYNFSVSGGFSLEWSDHIWSDVRSVAIGDVDNDGDNELVVGTANWSAWDIRVYDNGSLIWNDTPIPGSQFIYVTVGDVDNDGNNEIAGICVSDEGAGYPDSAAVVVYKYNAGTFDLIWHKDYSERSGSGVGIYDVDNDGANELAVITGPAYYTCGEFDLEIYENFNFYQGAIIDVGPGKGSPSVNLISADLDNNGTKEFLILIPCRIIISDISPTLISESQNENKDGIVIHSINTPFVERAEIKFEVPSAGEYSVELVDIAGRIVRKFYNSHYFNKGIYTIVWDGRADTGEESPAGQYILILRSKNSGVVLQKTVKLQKIR